MNAIDRVLFSGKEYDPFFEFWQNHLPAFGDGFAVGSGGAGSRGADGTRTTHEVVLGDPLSAALLARVNGNDTGLFVSLLTGVAILCRRYSGQAQVVIDSPLYQPGFTGEVYQPHVPLLLPVDDHAPLKEQLNQVRQAVKACYQYQNFPGQLLGDDPASPVFKTNVLVRYDAIHGAGPDAGAYDLVVAIERAGERISLRVQTNEAVLDPALTDALPGHLGNILAAYGQLATPVKAVNLLGAAERNRLLHEFNATRTGYPDHQTVHGLFEAQAARHPEGVAVVFEDRTLTYRELNQTANRLAHYLRNDHGVGPDQVVGLMVDRSERMIIGLLGILKAGGAYLPIDPGYPADRKAYLLADAGVDVLLTDADLMFSLESYAGRLVVLDIELPTLETAPTNPERVNRPDDLAYVIYTSGSTGRPKGVMIAHRSHVNMSLSQVESFGVVPEDGVLQFASPSFDASVYEIGMAFYAGAALVLVGRETIGDPARFVAYCRDKRVTIATLPPVYLGTLPLEALAFLRVIITAGEAPNPADAGRCARFAAYYNAYGPTECAVCATTYRVSEADRHQASLPIGRPIANTQVYILDAHGQPAPLGVEGEICLAGVGVARGYLNRPDLTAERFVANPFAEDGGRMYRTGDYGRWLPDGNIAFAGRKDDQVKVRGHRIETGEIEAVIRRHEGVREAYVYAAGSGSDKSLRAVLVPDPATARPLHQLLKARRENAPLLPQLHTLPNGMAIYHNNPLETGLIYREVFGEQTYRRHGLTLRAGDTVLDVGANIGLFSLYAGLTFPGVKLYAFEPVAPIYEVLRGNLALYNVDVTALPVGLSDEEKTVPFTYYPHNTAMSGRYADQAADRETVRQYLANQSGAENLALDGAQVEDLLAERIRSTELACRLRTLPAVVREYGIERIDLLKIDVEKSELDVVRGIDAPTWAKIRQIVIEVHDLDGHVAEIEALLRTHGFATHTEQDDILKDTRIFNVYGTRSPGAAGPAAAAVQADRGGCWVTAAALTADVKARLESQLPPYLVPGELLCLDELPLTPNGKVDRKQLLELESAARVQERYVAPENAVEARLAAAWEAVLGKSRVSVLDNFFAIGGDSIKAIQIAARMHQEGYKVEIKDIFRSPQIRELAAQVRRLEQLADQSPVTGPVPLTPIQREFFARPVREPHHYNQAILLYARQGFSPAAVEAVFTKIQAHHDALRMTYHAEGGVTVQTNRGTDHPLAVQYADLTAEADEGAALAAGVEALQAGFSLEKGPLMQLGVFRMRDGDRLLIVIHHLVVDGVSWRILLEDVETLYRQYLKGEKLALPLKTDSFQVWAQKLPAYAAGEALRKERAYWTKLESTDVPPFPHPLPPGDNRGKDARTLSFSLGEADTRRLLTEVHHAFNTEINDILLAAFGLGLHRSFGLQRVWVALEGHGREEVLEDVDVSRTVGWFTSVYPVLLDLSSAGDLSRQIVAVKEHLHKVPNKGIGYGLLRYLAPAEGAAPLALDPAISFNYLGQFNAGPAEPLLSQARESAGHTISPENERTYALDVTAMVREDALTVSIIYNEKQFKPGTLETLLADYRAALLEVIGYCAGRREKENTPSDFIYKDLSVEELENLFD